MEKGKGKEESNLKEALIASEIRYRRLFESAKTGILILDAETGMIVDVNPFLIDLLGYSKDEFIEKSIWEIGSFKDIYENKEKFPELRQSEYVRYEDLPLETSDGSKIHVEFVSNVYLVNNNKVIQCQIRDITARKETESALAKTRKELAKIKKSEDELNVFTENIIDTVREPLLAIDKDLRVIKANRSFYNFFKVTVDETIGKLIYELGNHQWDIPKLKELLEKIIPEKNTFDNYEVEHNFSTIGKRVMLLNARQVKSAFGKEKIILLAIEDITKRKGKEDILQETHSTTSGSLNTLLDLMQAPIIIWDTSMIIKRFNRRFELLSGYDSAEVIGKKIDFLFPKEKVAATLELLKKHLEDEPEVDEITILTKDNHIKTVLWNSSNILDEEGKNIIATISQDITNRRESELALRKSESHLRTLVNTIPDLIWLKDINGVYLSCNQMFERFFGAREADIIGKTDYDFVDPKLADFFRENDQKAMEAGKPTSNEEWVTFADDGHRAFLDTIKSPIFDLDRTVLGILGIGRDITERKKVEDALLESEIKYRAFFENSMDAILLTSPDGKTQSANQAACSMFGYSEDELIKLGRLGVVDATDPQLAVLLAERKLKGKARGEATFIRKDGTRFPAEISSALFKDHEGVEHTNMIIRDISERKQIQQRIKDSEKRFKAIFDQAPFAIALFDNQGRILISNLGLSEMIGYSLDELTGMTFSDFTYPEDIDKDMKSFSDLTNGKINSYTMEKRYFHKNGAIIWVNISVSLLNDDSGNIIEILGMAEDITERKNAENKLIDSEEKFRIITENSADAIFITDKEGKYIYVNTKAVQMLGYSKEEMMHFTIADISPKDKFEEYIEILKQLLNEGFATAEIELVAKDGNLISADFNAVTLPNGFIYASCRDIGERLEIQNKIKFQAELLSNVGQAVIATDLSGKITYWNNASEKIYGWSPAEAVGQNIMSITPTQSTREQAAEIMKKLSEGESWSGEFLVKGKDGNSFPSFVTNTPTIDADGKLTGIIGISSDITERKTAEIALQESELRFRNLYDNAKIGLYRTTPDGTILLANRLLLKMLGYQSFEKLAERKLKDDGFAPTYNREDFLEKIEKTGEVNNFESAWKHTDGSMFYVRESAQAVRNSEGKTIYYDGVVEDITQHKMAESDIAMLSQSLKSVNECVSITDLEDKIIFVNQSFLDTYGYELKELIGKPISLVRSPINEQNQVSKILSSPIRGEWQGELINKRKNGSEFPVYLSTTVVKDTDNKILGLIGVATDITERKRTEMELIEAKEKAEENDRLKTSFLANMSHEIRTPMNGILGFTGLLKNHGLSGEEQQEFIGVIEKSGARLLNIINDIICISKIESEQIPITLADTNINELIEFIYHFFKPETNQKNLHFSYSNALSDEEAFINTDSEKVYAILTNLVKNAIKFTEMGYIETGYTVKNGFIEFYVSDSGTGIPEEQREYIFERFRQGNDAFTRNYEGAGLGLAISKAYVEMLGGKIWMKNRSEEPTENGDSAKTGSVFYFTIPANFTQKTITNISINDIGDKTIINSKKLRILIVEDDMNSVMLLRIYVKMFAKEILHVSNGIEAVEICKKNDDIDLVLMDINLPGMNGYEATRKIRSFNNHVIIIAQTAYALSGDKEKANAAGCNNYISKPVNQTALKMMINSYFN